MGATPLRGQPGPASPPWPKRIIGVEFKILAEDFRDGLKKKLGEVEGEVSADISGAASEVGRLKFVSWMPLNKIKQNDQSRLGGVLMVSLKGDDFGGFGEQISLRFSMRTEKTTTAFGALSEILYEPVSNQPTGDRARLRRDVVRIVRAKLGLPEEKPTPTTQQLERTSDLTDAVFSFLKVEVPLAQDAEIPDRTSNLIQVPLLQQDILAREKSGMEIRFDSHPQGKKPGTAILRVLLARTGPLSCKGRVCGEAPDLEFNAKTYTGWLDWILPVFDGRVKGTLGVYMTSYVPIYDKTDGFTLQQNPL